MTTNKGGCAKTSRENINQTSRKQTYICTYCHYPQGLTNFIPKVHGVKLCKEKSEKYYKNKYACQSQSKNYICTTLSDHVSRSN